MLLAERETHRRELHETLQSILNQLERRRTRIKIDFSRVEKMYPGGTLVLLAFLELIIKRFPGRIVARCPRNSMPAQLFNHFGLSKMFGMPQTFNAPTHESVINWRYLTGTMADGTKISELIRGYQESIAGKIPDGLYDVLTEALINVKQHAYPPGCDIPDDLHRWWLFARYVAPSDNGGGNLYIGIYDIGVGIQNSLRPKLDLQELMIEKADQLASGIIPMSWLERVLLERAVEKRRTSTGLSYRGHGLPEMKEFIEGTESGKFYIISGKAQYVCIPSQSTSHAVLCQDLFLGTLILWSLPISH
jgi:hypothetical protein